MYAWSHDNWTWSRWIELTWQAGGTVFDDEVTKPLLTEAAGVETLSFIVEMFNEGWVPPEGNVGSAEESGAHGYLEVFRGGGLRIVGYRKQRGWRLKGKKQNRHSRPAGSWSHPTVEPKYVYRAICPAVQRPAWLQPAVDPEKTYVEPFVRHPSILVISIAVQL